MPLDSTPPGRPGKDDNPHDIQRGIATQNDLLWPFQDHNADTNYDDGTPVNASTLIDYYFMDGTDDQKRAVRSIIEKRLKPRGAKFVTWEDVANVKFRQVLNLPAHIRITFRVVDRLEDFRSAIGRNSINDRLYPPTGPTMRLIGLPDKYPPAEVYRGSVLHEFGHVLGLYHEHQSPTLEGYLGRQLDEAAIIAELGEQGARNEIITKPTNPFNYTRFDKDSIMLYQIKKEWQVRPTRLDRWFCKETGYNFKLSKLDQAFIRLLYPPDLSIQANRQPFCQTMVTAGVPANAAGRMLDVFVRNEGTLPQRLYAVRAEFNTVNERAVRLWNANVATLQRSIDPIALRRSGITGFVGEVTKDKLFQAIVKNIVYRTMEQSGIPTNVSLPGSNQNEVKRMLGALAMHDSVGYAVKCYDDQLGRKSDVAESSEPRDDIKDEDITPQFDSKTWMADAGGFGTTDVTKSKDERKIIIDAWNTISKKALLTWKEGSAQFNSHNIDAKGLLYYKDHDLIAAGTKAKWTLGGVAFYHDEWKVDNITAFFYPEIYGYAKETDLRSDNELFEDVKWESKDRL
ncbi:hypothetical protein JVT61DRAFT_4847 [Boletus reticuloceps]|uniref:Peptidase metallopeptidase domain-containing protein n=1 Tax=Boletus reticuloceps TaxID=495285 RepID=A0A8I3A8P9_9AGAM|nr:hypothetical protein JVT61DRAFT_4847 [Boletus reticuloceps]